jgi:hypothetical protein
VSLRTQFAVLWLAVLACLLVACPASPPQWPEDEGFDDHTVARIDSVAHFHTLAATGDNDISALKFIIVGFGDPKTEAPRFLDGHFYTFHDEWYWFRMYNGVKVPGSREQPLRDLPSFATIEDIVNWTRARKGPPPLGMRFAAVDRLYSDYFYELAIHEDRRALGIGTIVHFPARYGEHPRDELWGFELEYSDPVDEGVLEHFFTALSKALPAEIAGQLHFIARSPTQEQLVRRLRSRKHARAEQLLSYAELAVPGEIEVYNPGLIAGRLRKLPDDPQAAAKLLTEGDPRAIWLYSAVPDELPPAAGLLTAVPQTPLAHVNLLARNRGIPNVYVGGLLDDPQLDQLARVHAPVVMLAESDGTLVLEPISEKDYARWLGMARARIPTLSEVDVRALPYTIDLDTVALEHVPLLRSSAGGKSGGFPILRAAKVEMPERPLAITVRAYVEHIAELRPAIADALADPGFRNDSRMRYLLLEGREAFDHRFASEPDQKWVASLVAAHPADKAASDAIAQLLARDGIKRAIRERPLDAATASTLDKALRAQFRHFAVTQGLRFRSSSTVEDVEGFSGAGLYESNTGFLDAAAAPDKKDRKHDVEWALKKTWASYWSWEAFEERRMTGIDHLAGSMAVLVHARFDDEFELSNGVITLTLDKANGDQGSKGPYASMEIDVQLGALSVTNPPPERAGKVLPEVIRVQQQKPGGAIAIERVAKSTELPIGRDVVLDDAQVQALLRDCITIAERFLEVENALLDPARLRRRVTLDLEIRDTAPGWPAYQTAAPAPARMVIKQVRSLDPGVPPGAERLLSHPIPRELVLFADRIEQRSCRAGRTQFELIEVWTDPMAMPPFGHERVPYVARARVQARGLPGGLTELDLDHLELTAVAHPGMDEGGAWALRLGFAGTGAALDSIEFTAGLLHLRAGQQLLASEPAQCTTEILFASADGFLRSLVGR